MSLAVLRSRALAGMEALPVSVEVHLANGLPSFTKVGLKTPIEFLRLCSCCPAWMLALLQVTTDYITPRGQISLSRHTSRLLSKTLLSFFDLSLLKITVETPPTRWLSHKRIAKKQLKMMKSQHSAQSRFSPKFLF